MKKEIKNKEESVNKNWQQELMNHIPAGIGIVEVFFDGTLNLVYLNDGYYATIGKKREERTAYMGMNMIRVVHEDDRDLVVRDLLTAVDERRQFNSN